MNGTVNSEGIAGSYLFEYGTSATALTRSTSSAAFPGSTLIAAATSKLTGLSANTTYYFKLVATTTAGTNSGAVLSFKTP